MSRQTNAGGEIGVVVTFERLKRDATPEVNGRIECDYGQSRFTGWLDLLGRLEDIVDRARTETAAQGGDRPEA